MILPYAQNAPFPGVFLPNGRLRVVHPGEDWICRLDNADESILIFVWAVLALFVLFQPAKRNDARAETQTNQLMTAADSQHWNACRANKVCEACQDFILVIIEIAQCTTKHN